MILFKRFKFGFIGFAVTLTSLFLIIYSYESLEAALRGISIWWDVLFPALFPFFIISEILLGFGIVHFFGTLFDPMMRPLFRVPGVGGFVMAMGFASGYPIGARLTSQLWEQKAITREEGERLVAFTSTSDPIFLIGAVSIGFFHDVSLAFILLISHYGAGLIIGLLMRFHGRENLGIKPLPKPYVSNEFIIVRAMKAMHEARLQDGRDMGTLLKDAVHSSLKLVFMIGGLVVFFSVFLELLHLSGIMGIFQKIIEFFLTALTLPEALSKSMVYGLFEVTLGTKFAGETSLNIDIVHKLALAAFVLSWAGLSVHAQIASLLNQTNIRYYPFLIARFIHGIFAFALVYIIWFFFMSNEQAVQVFLSTWYNESNNMMKLSLLYKLCFVIFMFTILMIVLLYLVYLSCKWLRQKLQ